MTNLKFLKVVNNFFNKEFHHSLLKDSFKGPRTKSSVINLLKKKLSSFKMKKLKFKILFKHSFSILLLNLETLQILFTFFVLT